MTLDVERNQGDAVSQQEAPSQEDAKPSAETQKFFTQEEVDQMVKDRHSTLDKKIAKLETDLAEAQKSSSEAENLRQSLASLQKQQEEAELKAAEGDPDLLDSVKQKQALNRKEQELTQRERDLDGRMEAADADLARANEIGKKELAQELSSEFGLDVDSLMEFGSETPEQMRANAERLSKLLGAKPSSKPEPKATGMKPDSGAGSGVGVDYSKMSATEKIRYGLEQDKK